MGIVLYARSKACARGRADHENVPMPTNNSSNRVSDGSIRENITLPEKRGETERAALSHIIPDAFMDHIFDVAMVVGANTLSGATGVSVRPCSVE